MRFGLLFLLSALSSLLGTWCGWTGVQPRLRRLRREAEARDQALARARQAHIQSETMLDAVTDLGALGAIHLDAAGEPTHVSPSCHAVLGWSPTAIARGVADVASLADPDAPDLQCRMDRNGQPRWVGIGRRVLPAGQGTILVLRPVAMPASTRELDARSADAAPTVVDRTGFLRRLTAALAKGGSVAALLLDLRDLAGLTHEAVAARLAVLLGEEAVVAYLRDTEFALLLPAEDGDMGLAAQARTVLREMASLTRGEGVSPIASLGIAVGPRDGNEAMVLVRRADLALGHAKAAGGTYRFFEQRLEAGVAEAARVPSGVAD